MPWQMVTKAEKEIRMARLVRTGPLANKSKVLAWKNNLRPIIQRTKLAFYVPNGLNSNKGR
jgi:hypothetical protein